MCELLYRLYFQVLGIKDFPRERSEGPQRIDEDLSADKWLDLHSDQPLRPGVLVFDVSADEVVTRI